MDDLILKVRLLAKTELTLARFRGRRAMVQAVMGTVALLFVLLGLTMLNFAGYQAFSERFSPAVAALIVASVDIVIGGLIFILAAHSGGSGEEEKMAQEIRDLVYTELNADMENVKTEFSRVGDEVYRLRSGFHALTSGRSSGLLGLAPVIELILKLLRRKK